MLVRIGVDVGGTNTDAVLMEGDTLLAQAKVPTSPDVTSGIEASIEAVMREAGRDVKLSAVMLGTTHFTNALLEQRGLAKDRRAASMPPRHHPSAAPLRLARSAEAGHRRPQLHGPRRPRVRRTGDFFP